MSAPSRLIYVGGGKGGVGKSLVSMLVLDWLRSQERPVMLVDGELTNSDVALAYKQLVATETVDFSDGQRPWFRLGDIVRRNSGQHIVVNTPAGMRQAIADHGDLLTAIVEEIDGSFATLWPINRQRDSLNLLKDYQSVVTLGSLGVIRNLYFGTPDRFTRLANSTFAEGLIAGGAKVADLPDLFDDAIDDIYDTRTPIENVQAKLDRIRASAFLRWRNAGHQMLAGLL